MVQVVYIYLKVLQVVILPLDSFYTLPEVQNRFHQLIVTVTLRGRSPISSLGEYFRVEFQVIIPVVLSLRQSQVSMFFALSSPE